MIVTLLFLFSVIYVVMILLFAGAAATSKARPDEGYRPCVSVIIAARNEEEQIGACLDSIVALNYPQELLDIILVDDRSTDRTSEIVNRYTGNHAHIRMLRIGAESEFPPGKTNAVMSAVEISTLESVADNCISRRSVTRHSCSPRRPTILRFRMATYYSTLGASRRSCQRVVCRRLKIGSANGSRTRI